MENQHFTICEAEYKIFLLTVHLLQICVCLSTEPISIARSKKERQQQTPLKNPSWHITINDYSLSWRLSYISQSNSNYYMCLTFLHHMLWEKNLRNFVLFRLLVANFTKRACSQIQTTASMKSRWINECLNILYFLCTLKNLIFKIQQVM